MKEHAEPGQDHAVPEQAPAYIDCNATIATSKLLQSCLERIGLSVHCAYLHVIKALDSNLVDFMLIECLDVPELTCLKSSGKTQGLCLES